MLPNLTLENLPTCNPNEPSSQSTQLETSLERREAFRTVFECTHPELKKGISKDNGQRISSVQLESGEQWIVLRSKIWSLLRFRHQWLLSKEALTVKQEPLQAPV